MTNVGNPLSIIGVGELILDHISVTDLSSSDGSLRQSRGGGSVFNVLANLAQLGWETAVEGVVGEDVAGELALADLDQLGVSTVGVKGFRGRRTRLIFESLGARDGAQVGGSRHAFTTKCPVCFQRLETPQRPALRASALRSDGSARWRLYDQLTVGRIEHAKESKRSGARTVLDLGAVGYLRYQPTARVLSYLRLFDLIFLNAKVARSLSKRAGVAESALSSLIPGSVLVVTRGEFGATVTDGFGFVANIRAPEVPKIVDDAGAGDALCAYTLDHLARANGFGTVQAMEVADSILRSEQRIPQVLSVIGARGHLSGPPRVDSYSRLYGRPFGDVRAESYAAASCLLCHLPIESEGKPADLPCEPVRVVGAESTMGPSRAPQKPGARRNTSLLLNRMLRVAENAVATGRADDVLRGERFRTHVVGSGGSLPAAFYISDVLNAHGHFATALTPGDYLSDRAYSECVIVVSYSGSTHDHGRVIDAARGKEVPRIVLVTGSSSPTLAGKLRTMGNDIHLNYSPDGRSSRGGAAVRERGFVSIAGTVAPCVPWLTAALGIHKVVDMVDRLHISELHPGQAARELAGAAASARRLHVVYGPGGRPAALDIESKFVESGLPAVTLHEQKDLSHGRFVSVLQGPAYRHNAAADVEAPAPVLILGTGPATRYQQALSRALKEARVPMAFIESTAEDLTAPLELLTAVQWFSQEFGSRLGLDISRPAVIPTSGLDLYKWRGPLP